MFLFDLNLLISCQRRIIYILIYFICFITTRLLSAIEKGGLGEDNCFFFCSVTEASAECIMEASILGSEVFSRNENTRMKDIN